MPSYVLMLQTDEDDRYITEAVLTDLTNAVPVKYVARLGEIDAFVESEGEPSLILLNDNGSVAHKGGRLLKMLKADAKYNHIPVVILGEVSADDKYIRECYRAGANTFIIKPSTLEETRKKIATFFQYWFDVAEV